MIFKIVCFAVLCTMTNVSRPTMIIKQNLLSKKTIFVSEIAKYFFNVQPNQYRFVKILKLKIFSR